MLLEHISVMEELTVETKKTLLTQAVTQDRENLVKSMSEKFAIDVNEGMLENGSSLVHKAASCGSVETLKLFVEMTCDLNTPNSEGETCLHLAAGNGNTECIPILIQGGARPVPAPNWLIGDNQTPLMIATYNNYYDTVKALLPHSDVTCVSEYGDSALHYASARGCHEIVSVLVQGGAAANQRNCYNATPLWNGVTNIRVLNIMLKAGALLDVPSTGNNSLLRRLRAQSSLCNITREQTSAASPADSAPSSSRNRF